MAEITPLYFADFCAETGVEQCAWCGEFVLEVDLRWVSVDVPGNSQQGCSECLSAYYWKHHAEE